MSAFAGAFSGAAAGNIALAMVKLAIDHAAFESDLKKAKGTFERELAEMGQNAQRVRNVGAAMASVGVGMITALGNKAAEAEQSNNRLRLTLENMGITSEREYQRIQDSIARLSVSAAKDDEQLADSFDKLARYTGNTADAMSILNTATNAANATGRDLESVVQALIQGYNGQARGLRALGIMLPENVKGMQAMDFVMRKFKGANDEFTASATGGWEQAKVAWENAEEAVGAKLLPTLTKLFSSLAKGTEWITKLSDAQIQALANTILWGTGLGGILAIGGQLVMWLASFTTLLRNYTAARIAANAADATAIGNARTLAGLGGLGGGAAIGAGVAAAAGYAALVGRSQAEQARFAASFDASNGVLTGNGQSQSSADMAAEGGVSFADRVTQSMNSPLGIGLGPLGAGLDAWLVGNRQQALADASAATQSQIDAMRARGARSQAGTVREQVLGLY